MYTLNEIIEKKRILGLSNEALSRRSGVPLGTVQKVMSGITKNPREKTLKALSRALILEESSESKPFLYPYSDEQARGEVLMLRDSMSPAYQDSRVYTMEDIEALPEEVRAELIDGKIYYMAQPTRTHQRIVGEMYLAVANYIRAHDGKCEVYLPPFGVDLFADRTSYLEPDLTVICDTDKLDEKGCHGAPDWVTEVLSPSTKRKDNVIKLNKYRKAGVKEYWIIYPDKRIVMVYLFGKTNDDDDVSLYSFEDEIPCSLYPDLKIRLADHL